MSKIAVLGSGSWGTALASVLLANHHSLTMWGIDENQIKHFTNTGSNLNFMPEISLTGDIAYTTDINVCLQNVDYILNTVPTQHIRSSLQLIKAISQDVIIINASKGLEIGSNARISSIFKEYFPDNAYAVLSGPSHAEEVIKKMPTTVVSASEIKKIAFDVQDLFMTDNFRVYAHPDVLGVELAAGLKNVIAIGAGICDGLGFGDNTLAALMTRGIAEIKRLGYALGAKTETFDGLAGIGDLMVTCMSNHSRNRRCGQLIGKGYSLEAAIAEIGMAVEGAHTIKAVNALRQTHAIDMPITKQLFAVLYQGQDAKSSVLELMQRDKKHELDEWFTDAVWKS